MSYKAIALDLDGTLVNSKKELTVEVIDELDRIRSSGCKVILASGRPTEGVLPVARALDMKNKGGYIMSFNGGKIIDCSTDETIYTQTIDKSIIPHIREYVEDSRCVALTYKSGKIITKCPEDHYLQVEAAINKMEVLKTDDFWEEISCAEYAPNKLLLTAEPEYAKDLAYEMSREFYGRLNVFRSEPYFIEIVPLGIDKGKSLDKLMSIFGYTRDNLIACGDGLNDLTMIEYAGLGVAMKNACDELIKKADFIGASNDDNGVAKVIRKYFI